MRNSLNKSRYDGFILNMHDFLPNEKNSNFSLEIYEFIFQNSSLGYLKIEMKKETKINLKTSPEAI